MKKNNIGLPVGLMYAGVMALTSVHADLVRNPVAMGANFDLGQVVRGAVSNTVNGGADESVNDQVLTRTGVYLTESGTYNDRFSVQLTVGGLFWYAIPPEGNSAARLIKFGPGVGQAQGQYSFGDIKNPVAKLRFGLFPEKYNPDAKDLGEYLFRSTAYPTVITTGGWSFIDAASYMAQGATLTVPMLDGKISNEFTLFMERDLEPNGDLDPGYLLTVKPTPYLEFGGGVEWTHAIQFRSESDLREAATWGYNKNTGLPFKDANGNSIDTASNADTAYYTFESVKLMARASLDVGTLLNIQGIGPGDFKLYAEWAWLGVKDYPYFYGKASERMPVMGGIDIPTFKLLDKLSVEVEYHKSRFQDNLYPTLEGPRPGEAYVAGRSQSLDSAEFTKDDVHWCFYARRHIYDGISLVAQVASDHLRPFDNNVAPAYIPVTDLTRQWYYVLRLEVGI